jgi:hypothetical protein
MELIIYNRKGKAFTVLHDDDDLGLIRQYTWHVSSEATPYARTQIRKENGKYRYILMHKLLMGADKQTLVDHKNHNTLDNRKSNLREATMAQNSANRRPCGRSKYLGVCLSTGRNKWQATIKANGKYKMLGRFDTQEEAALAYDEAAKVYHGEFANLNFPTLQKIA